jgi:hypothetical protein
MPAEAAWHCSIVAKPQLVMWPVTSCRQKSPAVALPVVSAPKMAAAAMAVAGAPSRKNKFIFFTPNFLSRPARRADVLRKQTAQPRSSAVDLMTII